MTDPKYAASVPGKGRWYTHPVTGEHWPSVTNILDTAIAKPALVPWAAKITAHKAWDLQTLMVASYRVPQCTPKRGKERCGRCSDCVVRTIKGEHIYVRDLAADLGTRVHALVEAHAKDTPRPDDPEAEPFAKQALRFFTDWGVNFDRDVIAAEATILNRSIGYAGTGDLWVMLRHAGKKHLTLIDYKSSSTRPAGSVYVENGMQLAALAHGETLLLDDGSEVECPGPIASTAVLNLRVDDYALIPMPHDQNLAAAYTAFQGALATALYVHGRYGEKPSALAAPTVQKVA